MKGVVLVSELSEGDVIFGMTGSERKPAWCKVVAVFPAAADKNKITHDGFKTDHMVIDHTIHPYNKKGEKRMGLEYTLVTDCDAAVKAAGQAFTPISTAICPHELSWSEYITLMSVIRRFTNHSGYFWFDTLAYRDNHTAMPPHWVDQLHEICRELLLCARDGQCRLFEIMMETFVQEHLNKEYVEIVERVFSNVSGDVEKQEGRIITQVVRPHSGNHTVPFIAVGSAIGVLLLIAVIIVTYGIRMMEKEGNGDKEPFSNERLE